MSKIKRIIGTLVQPIPELVTAIPEEDRFQPLNQREANILAQLHPALQKAIKITLYRARNSQLSVGIFEGLRTWERQESLYAQGRDAQGNIIDKSKVVTMAKPGSSFHNYGIAADLVFLVNGKWSWADELPWHQVGLIGTQVGLEWAGYWTRFREMPHFQLKTGTSIAQLAEWYKQGGLPKVWEEIDKLV